jgi:hypothetical protein
VAVSLKPGVAAVQVGRADPAALAAAEWLLLDDDFHEARRLLAGRKPAWAGGDFFIWRLPSSPGR